MSKSLGELMAELAGKKLTKNYSEVPLFYVNFDLNKYQKHGAIGSCDLRLHPYFKGDEHIKNQLNDLVNYIRENYDMEDLSK